MMPLLETIKIGQPTQRSLKVAGIDTLMQLCDYTEKEILALHGIGPKAAWIFTNRNLDLLYQM